MGGQWKDSYTEETDPTQEGQFYDAAKGPWRLGCSEGEPLPSSPHLLLASNLPRE